MSRSFDFNLDVGQQITVPGDSIFDSLAALTLAGWVKISDYGASGFPILAKDSENSYATYLYINSNGTITGGAAASTTHNGYVDGLGVNPGQGGIGYAVNDTGTCAGHGDGLCQYRVAAVDGLGAITDLNGVSGKGGSGYAINDTGALTPGGAQPGSGVGGQYKVLSTTTLSFAALAISTTVVPLDTWTHVALTWDVVTGTIHLYVNGVEVTYASSLDSTTVDPSTEGWWIGGDTFEDLGVALIAETVIYDSKLSALEVAALAASTTGAPGAPVGYWHLCGLLSPETDASGNGNDATLVGTPPPAQGAVSPGFGCATVPPPTVDSINPASAHQGTTKVVTVLGSDFDDVAAVLSFSGTKVTVHSYVSRAVDKIVAVIQIAADAATTARDVTVTNGDAQADTLSAAFTVVAFTSSGASGPTFRTVRNPRVPRRGMV